MNSIKSLVKDPFHSSNDVNMIGTELRLTSSCKEQNVNKILKTEVFV